MDCAAILAGPWHTSPRERELERALRERDAELARSVAINEMWLETFAGHVLVGAVREAADISREFLRDHASFSGAVS